MLKLTSEELEACKTPKGGFTRKQIEAWGIPWPPPKGWKQALLAGTWDTEDFDFRAEMTAVELHDLFRKVVSAIVSSGHASDLYEFPDVLAYFGAQIPEIRA